MLVAFNFDGSLSDSDAYTMLAEEAGVREDVAAVSEQSRAGDVTLPDSIRRRASMLEGLPELEMESALERVRLRDGAGELLSDVHAEGHHVAVVTAAPRRAVDHALEDAGVGADTVAAPVLEVERNALTGEVTGRLLEESKGEVVEAIAVENEITADDIVAVGSDDNDHEMLATATDSICYDPTGGMEQHCESTVASMDQLREEFAQRNLI